MSDAYKSSADLKGVDFGGYINEDVMQQIIRVLDLDTVFTNMIGSDSVDNSYTEWPKKKYVQPDITNAVVDGADAGAYNQSLGQRVGNHCQISRKVIAVTTRARNSDVIGVSDEYAEELMFQTEQLRRDVEAISLTGQGSQADDGNATPGKAGGAFAWLETNLDVNGTTGGGFSNGQVAAIVPGTPRALTEKAIRDVSQAIYKQGFKPSHMMARPDVIRLVSEYMFTDAARIGIQQTETGKDGASTAVGSVKIFITDHDVELRFTPNELMQTLDAPTTSLNDGMLIFDPGYWRHGYLHGYRTEPLSKTGLADKAQVAVDWTLKCLAEEASGAIMDIDASAAMVQT